MAGDISGTSITGGGATPPPAGGQQPPPGGGDIKAAGPKIQVDFAEANQALAHLDEAWRALDTGVNMMEYSGNFDREGPGKEEPSRNFMTNYGQLSKQELTNIVNQRDAVKAMYDNLKAQLGSQTKTEQTNSTNLSKNQ